MAFVEIPKDLTKIPTKIVFGLTKRQLIGFSVAALIFIPTFLFFKNISSQLAMVLSMALSSPSIFLTLYQRDGIPAEELLKSYLKFNYINPKIRKFKTTRNNAFLKRGFTHDKKKRTARKKT